MKDSKNNPIIMLIVICLFLFLILLGYIYLENNSNSKSDSNNFSDTNSIIFTGDESTYVTYSPSFDKSYNYTYKIDKDGKLNFIDNNNKNNNFTYNSIIGKCKYVTLARPNKDALAYYRIAVITEEGNVFYKEVYPSSHLNTSSLDQVSTFNDNFVKVDTKDILVGITVLQNPYTNEEEDIVVYKENGSRYFISAKRGEGLDKSYSNDKIGEKVK